MLSPHAVYPCCSPSDSEACTSHHDNKRTSPPNILQYIMFQQIFNHWQQTWSYFKRKKVDFLSENRETISLSWSHGYLTTTSLRGCTFSCSKGCYSEVHLLNMSEIGVVSGVDHNFPEWLRHVVVTSGVMKTHGGRALLFPTRNRRLLCTVPVPCHAPSNGPACRAWLRPCTSSASSGLRVAGLHSCSLDM